MKVLVGVTGGIAAYKSAELVRELQQHDIDVQVAMTEAAEKFIAPLTFSGLTGNPVLTSLWNSDHAVLDGAIEHIAVAQRIEVLVIAPATADFLARLAHGLAGDYLSTVCLATTAPIVVAPAMNVNMWENVATQANLDLLRQRGVIVVPPEDGYLACGMVGGGRLAPIANIVGAVLSAVNRKQDLAGRRVMVTAGGTREPIDPVRYLGNRSSGKMGHALAQAARDRGAQVLLITASALPIPDGCEAVHVTTASEMEAAVLAHLPKTSMVIMAAAVADFRPSNVSAQKIRRSGKLMLELKPTEDIVKKIVEQRSPGTRVIAFAAETEDIESNGREKLRRKGVDALVSNDVSLQHRGFDSDSNAGFFLTPDTTVTIPESSKRAMADQVLDEVLLLDSRAVTASSR